MSTIESINRSERVPLNRSERVPLNRSELVPLVQESCPAAEGVRATSKDPSNQKRTFEEKVKSLASSLLDSLKPPSSTSHPSLMTSDLTEDYISAADAHKKNRDLEKAAEDYISAADAHKKNRDPEKAAECYLSAADAYKKNGDLEKAAKCCRLASSEYCRVAGDACKKLGHSKKADKYYSLAAYVCLENPDSSTAQQIRNVFSSSRS